MSHSVSIHALIVDSLKLSVREFLHWFRLNYPGEHLYGLLIDVPTEGDAANIIGATEEGLERAVREVAKAKDSVDNLREALRWASPGESGEPWFWGEHEWARATTHLILLGIARGKVTRYSQTVTKLVLKALRELDSEQVFGTGRDRDRLFVGVVDIHIDFEMCVELSTQCNPRNVVARVLAEVARGESMAE